MTRPIRKSKLTPCARNRRAITAALLIAAVGLMPHRAAAETKVKVEVEQELAKKSSVRVIIRTRPDPEVANGGLSLISPSAYLAQVLQSDGSRLKQLGSFRAVVTRITVSDLARLRNDPNIEAVFADIPVPPSTDLTGKLIGADKVHAKGFKGTNLAVAVLDTGVDGTHPALQNAIAAEACFSTSSASPSPSKSLCPNGLDVDTNAGAAGRCPSTISACDHGTHVSGIVAGRSTNFNGKSFQGVSPGARVVAVQVFSIFSDPVDCRGIAPCVLSYPSDQLRALDWIYKRREQHKIASVNMSLGGGYFDQPCDGQSPLTEVIERLRAKGVLTVISAGNDHFYDGVGMPGCISSAVTVAASTKAGTIDISYSNVSPYVDLVAPGTQVFSSVFGKAYQAKSGTSMAAPHVAGAFALLREEFPTASAAELEAKLKVGAPTVVDARTGTKLTALEIAHSLPPPSGGPAGPAVTAPDPLGTVAEHSFIIMSAGSAQQITSAVTSKCGANCELKRISDNAWKVDVPPGSAIDVGTKGLTTDELKKALSTLPADAKIYSNTPSAPH